MFDILKNEVKKLRERRSRVDMRIRYNSVTIVPHVSITVSIERINQIEPLLSILNKGNQDWIWTYSIKIEAKELPD